MRKEIKIPTIPATLAQVTEALRGRLKVVGPDLEERPEDKDFRDWVQAWQADGCPTRLGFAARFTARLAALRLKQGSRPAEIRLELWSRALAVCEHFGPGVRSMFLGIIRQRLDEAIGPAPEAPPQEKQR